MNDAVTLSENDLTEHVAILPDLPFQDNELTGEEFPFTDHMFQEMAVRFFETFVKRP